MSNQYYLNRNRTNLRHLNLMLDELPSFCSVYFVGMSTTTTPLTRLGYARDLKTFFNYLVSFERPFMKKTVKNLEIEDLNNVTNFMIENYINYLSCYDEDDGKVRENTESGKKRKLCAVRSFFQFFYEKSLLKENVSSKVRVPKIHDKAIIRLVGDESKDFLKTSETLQGFSDHQQKINQKYIPRDQAILILFLGTGIRVSELVGLNVEDIDLKSNSFKIVRKGGNQTILYYNDEVKQALITYLKFRENLKLPDDEKALFISIQNKRMGVRSVENMVKKYAKVAVPLKNITPHKLRSTFGTNLYHQSGDIYLVAEVLGHHDVNTTKKHYAAMSEDLKKTAADIIKITPTSDNFK